MKPISDFVPFVLFVILLVVTYPFVFGRKDDDDL